MDLEVVRRCVLTMSTLEAGILRRLLTPGEPPRASPMLANEEQQVRETLLMLLSNAGV